MKQIALSSSLLVYLDELEFTEAALRADPDAAELAEAFDEEVRAWPEVFQKQRAAFRGFFPTAPSEFVRGALRKRSERTRDVIVRELEKLPAGSSLRAFSTPLLTGAKAAIDALVARAKAQGEAATVGSDVTEWKEGVNRLRTTTHAELVKIAVAQNLGRAWPEVFFRTADTARAEGEGNAPPEPVVPPRPPTAGPTPGRPPPPSPTHSIRPGQPPSGPC